MKKADGTLSDEGSYEDKNLQIKKNGIFEMNVVRDDDGNIVEILAKGIDGKVIALNKTGATAIKLTYDEVGHVTSMTWIKDGKPVLAQLMYINSESVAIIQFRWNGNDIESINYFDASGQPTMAERTGSILHHKSVNVSNSSDKFCDVNGSEVQRR